MDGKTRVLIVDDHAILRMGLSSLINATGDCTVVGEAADGEEGVARALALRPDVVIMDLMMPRLSGVEATQRLHEALPSVRILILTTYGTSDVIARALESGAAGAVMKNCDFGEIVKAVQTIAAGGTFIAPDVKRLLKDDPPTAPLSNRQLDILKALVQGRSNPDIARELGISIDMVKEHTQALFQKIGASNRTEAVAIALRRHLLPINEIQEETDRRSDP